MTEPAPSQLFRARLLEALLPIAAAEGWTSAGLARAATEAGLSEGEALLAAPNGPDDMIDAFAAWADDAMAAHLAALPLAQMKIRMRVTAGVEARLAALAPHKEAVRRSVRRVAVRGQAGEAARLAWRTADRLWSALGDRSTDENFYSKRAILAAVHAATLAYWLTDSTPDHDATARFLAARIEGVMSFEKWKAGLAPLGGFGATIADRLARLRYRGGV